MLYHQVYAPFIGNYVLLVKGTLLVSELSKAESTCSYSNGLELAQVATAREFSNLRVALESLERKYFPAESGSKRPRFALKYMGEFIGE